MVRKHGESNQRFEYRTPIQIIVDHMRLQPDQPAAGKGYIREISASGCRIESALKLELGQEILVSFVIQGGYTVVNAPIRIIRILKPRQHLQVVAGQFVNLPEADQYKIREYVIWKEAQREKQL
jgi:c-di-GMP-binding flagellar brake protein YcgR